MKIGNTIYLDHQATTPLDSRILPEISRVFGLGFGNPHSEDHVIGWNAARTVERSAASVASLVGADPDEVIFTSGATEANNLAILGVAGLGERAGRHRVLLSAIEHKSVLAAGRELERRRHFSTSIVRVDQNGRVDWDALSSQLDDGVLLVSVMAVNNEIGSIQDFERIASLTHAFGALFHCDAAQAPCAIDVQHLAEHADLISLSSHKIYGPGGIGALIVRRDLKDRLDPQIYGGGQQYGLRSGTVPVALCVGFAGAADLLRGEDGAREREHLRSCRDNFLADLLALVPSLELNGPFDAERHPGNVNLLIRGVVAADLLASLQPLIAASSGSACSSGIPEPSYVLRAIGRTGDEADSSIRFSFGRYTTIEESREAARIVAYAILRLRENLESSLSP
jgi:cysteine desulfurase